MKAFLRLFISLIVCQNASSFQPTSRLGLSTPFRRSGASHRELVPDLPNHVQRQRRSVAIVQTMGLFGLGVAEIAIILVGIGVVLGPEKLMGLAQSSGDTAKEFKTELSKVPDEFKKGMEEGEIEARSRKAKPIKRVVVQDKHSKSSEDQA